MRELSRSEVHSVSGSATALGAFGALLVLPFYAIGETVKSNGQTGFWKAFYNGLQTIIY